MLYQRPRVYVTFTEMGGQGAGLAPGGALSYSRPVAVLGEATWLGASTRGVGAGIGLSPCAALPHIP
jgi:hypothetical protein